MRHTRKYAAHFARCGTLGKMHHIWKKAAHLEKGVKLKKSGTLGKMGQT